MPNRTTIKNNLLAVLACLLWSTAFVAVKHALAYQQPLTLAGQRFLLAGLLQLPLCGSLLAPLRLMRREFGTVVVVSLFQTVLLYGTFFIGMQWVRGAEAAIMIGGGPLASALMAHWLMHNDKMQPRMLAGILFGMTGIAFISLASKPWNPVGLREFFGLLLLLSGSFISAAGNIIVAKRRGGLHPIALNSAQMLIGGPVLLLIATPIEGLPGFALPPVYYGHLLWLAIISAVAFAIWFHLLAKVKVSKLNLWKFLIPLAGACISWICLPGESPTGPSLIGMVLIVSGIIIARRDPKQPPQLSDRKCSS